MLPGSMRLAALTRRPEAAVLLSLFTLAVWGLAGDGALLGLVVGLPILWCVGLRGGQAFRVLSASDQVINRLDAALRAQPAGSGQTGCLVLQFDDTSWLCDRHGRKLQSALLAACIGRLRGAMRPGDQLFPQEDGSLVVGLAPSQRLDLEGMVRIAGRLQMVVQQPMVLDGASVQVTCCIGFCHARQLAAVSGRALLEAAQIAADEAFRHRPGAIRSFSQEFAAQRAARDALRAEFIEAVDAGQIRAHFQPQLSTDTGAISGMEALARWHHPDRGLLSPAEFLPALEGTDLMALLGREMLTQSLAALVHWDRAGLAVPVVAVNVSPPELADPRFPEHLDWALATHGLAPRRLTVEVLETVIAGKGDDVIRQNLGRVAAMGCGIDLDDFGTGNASITTIRHFPLRRLKIDRSFVRGVDCNRDQQCLVTAILAMAEQLGLETLAEGVETQAEHAMLAQLGCGHVQGYVIARPLPPETVAPWVQRHRESQAAAVRIALRAR